jgi:hypothetical protein
MYSTNNHRKRLTIRLVVLIMLTLIIVLTASAHVPIRSSGNESLATATLIPDLTKSRVVYAALHEGGDTQYYKFEAAKGQPIHLTLFTSTSMEDAHFTPGIILIGPGVPNHGFVPPNVEIQPVAGVMAVNGMRAKQATYEAFAPSSFVTLADISLLAPANGMYYVAIQDAAYGGHYGLAIGDRESFTVVEWILNPIAVLSVYTWERQSLLVVLWPALAILVVGLILLIRRQRRGLRLDTIGFMVAVSGFLYLGTGATIASQMILSINRSHVDTFVIFTLVFTILSIILGLLAIRIAVRNIGYWTFRSRFYLFLLGVGAFATWAGFLIGPILAISAAFIPSKTHEKHRMKHGDDA